MNKPNAEQLAAKIDHAMLRPEATPEDLQATCARVLQWHVACLCVRPCDVADATRPLAGSGVAVGTVIGFPHGTTHQRIKAAEAACAVDDGAEELDMVINLGRMISGDLMYVRNDIAAVVKAAGGRIVKVILECGYLNRSQMAVGCQAAWDAGAQFVKTCTGFGPGRATLRDVRFFRQQVGSDMRIKAAGGIRTAERAWAMIAAGADRIGTSSTEAILSSMR